MREFTYRSARAPTVTVAIVAVLLIETLALHFLIAARHPSLAWPLTLLSLVAVLWIVRDYRAFAVGRITLDDDALDLHIGRRFDIRVPLAAIDRILAPTFRDLPAPGTKQGRDYLNLTKPAPPNVLIVLDQPRRMRLTAGMHRSVKRLGVHVDNPAAFLQCLSEARIAQQAQMA